jgi:hypothetical protein
VTINPGTFSSTAAGRSSGWLASSPWFTPPDEAAVILLGPVAITVTVGKPRSSPPPAASASTGRARDIIATVASKAKLAGPDIRARRISMRMLRQSGRRHSIFALLAHRSVSWAVLTSWRSRKCTSRWPSLPCRELAGAALRGPSGTLIKRAIRVLAAGLGIGGFARIADILKLLGRVVIRGPNGRSPATATLISRVAMGIRAAPRMRLFEKPAARYIDYTLQLFLLRMRESGIGRWATAASSAALNHRA